MKPAAIVQPIPEGMRTVTPHLVCDGAEATAGAKLLRPVAEMFWGDRYGVIEDPCGHHSSVATHVRDVPPDEWAQAMQAAVTGATS